MVVIWEKKEFINYFSSLVMGGSLGYFLIHANMQDGLAIVLGLL